MTPTSIILEVMYIGHRTISKASHSGTESTASQRWISSQLRIANF
ncbi:hypothetical protein SC1_02275 [Sphingopyxis sp. C-1]|nr:hypothetical protein SC1_02275 [Sphingopyxis sp. C-1]